MNTTRESCDGLVADLILDEGRTVRGRLDDFDTTDLNTDALLVFPAEDAVPVAIGQRVRLAVRRPGGKRPIPFEGHVVYEGMDFGYELRVRLPETATRQVRSLVNCRRAIRVHPPVSAPVEVQLAATEDGDWVPATVQDLSATGVSAYLDHDRETEVARGWDLRVRVRLPDESEPLCFAGKVRYRRLRGAAVQYGIEFDEDATENFSRLQELVIEYVVACQSELIRSIRNV